MDSKDNGAMYRKYVTVWLFLIALTAATVTVAGMGLGTYGALGSIIIASIKTGLILLFFMHLRDESALIRILLLLTVLAVALIIGLTFTDLWFRYGEMK